MKTKKSHEAIPLPTLKRMRAYLNFLRFAILQNRSYVSAERIAEELSYTKQTVLDDLSYTAAIDPVLGITNTQFMIDSIEKLLGFNHENEFIYIGNIAWYIQNKAQIEANIDLTISAFFDNSTSENPKMGADFIINPISKITDLAERLHIERAIIAPFVDLEVAKKLVLLMSEHGVKLVWNLAEPIVLFPDNLSIINTPISHPNDLIKSMEQIKNQLV